MDLIIKDLSFGIVIPCFNGHIQYLKRLLYSIYNQTVKPDIIILSCSSSETFDIPDDIYNYPLNLKIFTHSIWMNASQNRNFGRSKCSTDIISFFDADDEMHPNRIEIIKNIFKNFNDTKLVLHSYEDDITLSFNHLIDFIPIKLSLNKRGIIRHHNEIANGHMTIHSSVNTLFNETKKAMTKEDSIFNREIMYNYPNSTIFCNLKLSKYYRSGTQYFHRR